MHGNMNHCTIQLCSKISDSRPSFNLSLFFYMSELHVKYFVLLVLSWIHIPLLCYWLQFPPYIFLFTLNKQEEEKITASLPLLKSFECIERHSTVEPLRIINPITAYWSLVLYKWTNTLGIILWRFCFSWSVEGVLI